MSRKRKYDQPTVTRSIRLPEYILEQIVKNYGTLSNWVELKVLRDKLLSIKEKKKD